MSESSATEYRILPPAVIYNMTLHHHRLLLDRDPSTMANASRTRSAYAREANFDTNMVIILAALLCALICALGLNSIVRCALRCTRRFAVEETTERLAATGLKKSVLQKIPVVAYGTGIGILATDCSICLGEFTEGEKVRVLPKCRHGFHMRCIDTWLVSHSSCPTCRQSPLDQPASPDAVVIDSGIRNAGDGSGMQGGDMHLAGEDAS